MATLPPPAPDTRATWRPRRGRLTSLAAIWAATVKTLEARPEGPLRQKRYQDLWNQAPWLFVLDSRLIDAAAERLELPEYADREAALSNARGARLRDGWLDGVVPSRSTKPRVERVATCTYQYLVERGHPPKLVAAFLDRAVRGQPSSRSKTATLSGDLRAEFVEHGVHEILVPLTPTVPTPAGASLDDWLNEWLLRRADRDLWLVFGKSLRYLYWKINGKYRYFRHATAALDARWSVDVVEVARGRAHAYEVQWSMEQKTETPPAPRRPRRQGRPSGSLLTPAEPGPSGGTVPPPEAR